MKMKFDFSQYKLSSLIGFYAMLFWIYIMKTMYHYTNHKTTWWMYLCIITLLFIFAAYYCIRYRPKSMGVILLLSLVVSLMPFDLVIPQILYIFEDPLNNLSGLAQKLPLVLGVLLAILFYPILTVVLFLLMHFSLKTNMDQDNNKKN